jgi:hypothetical protein
MDEVEGEAVVVVDQDNHAPGQRFRRVYGRAGRGSSTSQCVALNSESPAAAD